MTQDSTSLKGELLIAVPAMSDPRFHHAVILICSHDASGAMGVIINNVLPGLSFANMAKQFDIQSIDTETLDKITILGGGPIETSRGFVIHKQEYSCKDTIPISDSVSITGTLDILKDIASGNGPRPFLFALGYAGWTAGQLEQEITENAWLNVTPDNALVFDVKPEQKWQMALAKLGIEPGFLSSSGGNA